MYTIVTIIIVAFVFALVAYWALRGRRTRHPEAGPSVPDLGTAEELQRVEPLHDEGRMTDAEYHEARSRLLS